MRRRSDTDPKPMSLKLEQMQKLLVSGTFTQVRELLRALTPVEIARLIESSPPPSRAIIWELIERSSLGEVIEELPFDVQTQFLQRMSVSDLVLLTDGLDADDIVDILQHLPERVASGVLQAMRASDRERVSVLIDFDEHSAGGLTNPDVICVRPRLTLSVVARYLRRHDSLPKGTDALYVIDKNGAYLGTLPLAAILTQNTDTRVGDAMIAATALPAAMPARDVAALFEQHDWVSAPVVDAAGKLIGRITIDDVVDVIRENADHALMSLAGLDEEDDTFATIARTAPRRAVWLGINLFTAILASSVISIFQDTIDKVVALAILMPIVASMGGVAGSQTLTVVIRGMALGHIGRSNLRWLLYRECWVGLINGGIWALLMAGIAGLWFGDPIIALIIALAMVINLLAAALAGALLPGLLKRCHIDPALAGGVTLTTLTDVVGFFAFLGLATYFYG